ncbi:MAG: hypothetical protein QOI31_2947 [Solirubrobacterales bacterium]|jgi:hypothetical protein|nr:hypothetical protein [Solirubrobacterales bacterium]
MKRSNKVREAIRSNVLGIVAIYIALGGTALALPGKNTVDSGDIKNGQVKGVDVAQDGLTGEAIDEDTLQVPWAQLTGIPAGFADGVDNVGGGSGGDATDLHCPAACIEASEIGDGQVVGSKLALPLTITGTPASGPLVDIQNGGAAGTRALRGATSGNGIGVVGTAGGANGWGVYGSAPGHSGKGVAGEADGQTGIGVDGSAHGSFGMAVRAIADGSAGTAIVAAAGDGPSAYAGKFEGQVLIGDDLEVQGTLSKSAGSFKIDHPLDPANEYLQHSFVESPDMKNIYDGVVTTGEHGFAQVKMPDWFEALNRDFRYQLTVHGHTFSQAIVWRELKDGTFVIRTDEPATEVSWQVTGIRHDAYAKANPIEVEVPKRGDERGRYLSPELFGEPQSRSIGSLTERERSR